MIDLVAGAAHGYTEKQIRPFLRSLRENGYQGHILMYVNGMARKECEKWQAESRECPPALGKPHAHRFLWLLDGGLRDHKCEGILLADTRDVIFQDNLEFVPAEGLHVFEEDKSQTIGSCPYNSEWVKIGYGIPRLAELQDFPISCVGVTCGDRTSVLNYLSALCSEIRTIQPKTNKPQDQAAHNHLIRGPVNATIWGNEEGEVYTVGYLPRESVQMIEGKIVNKVGMIPTIVHQWDRHQNLSAWVEEHLVHTD